MIGPVGPFTTSTWLRLLVGNQQRSCVLPPLPLSLLVRPQVLCSVFVVATLLHTAEPGLGWGKDQSTTQLLLKFIISTFGSVGSFLLFVSP